MFASALKATQGQANDLNFAAVKSVCVILVDGLGSHNLRAAGGHARFLNSALQQSKGILAGFPSTTAVSITSFGTGLTPNEHGIFGYKVVDPDSENAVNMLSDWSATLEPTKWQSKPTVAELAASAGKQAWIVGPSEYEGSGFTQVSMRGAKYAAAKTIEQRFGKARELLMDKTPKIIYLYVPELDQLAHAHGSDSDKWLGQVEHLDGAVAEFTRSLPKSVGAALTADHGIVNVPRDNHIYLDEYPCSAQLSVAAGDPRCIYAYLAAGTQVAAWVENAQSDLGERVLVAAIEQVESLGWFGGVIDPAVRDRLPQAIILAKDLVALYDRRSAPAKSLNMVGQHGGISDAELQVPLLRWGI